MAGYTYQMPMASHPKLLILNPQQQSVICHRKQISCQMLAHFHEMRYICDAERPKRRRRTYCKTSKTNYLF